MSAIPPTIRQQVIEQAQQCCEYCQTQQRLKGLTPVGRATVSTLKVNNEYVVASR